MNHTPLSAIESFDDPDVEPLIADISEQLQLSISNDPTPNELAKLRDSCTNIQDLIVFHERVGHYFSPPFVSILECEVEKSHNSAVNEMLLGGFSRDIERVVTQILSDISGAELVRAYQKSDQEIVDLIKVLGQVIDTSRTTQAAISSIEALAALTKSIPERIATELPVEYLVPNICEIIPKMEYADQYRAGMRLLGMLSVFTTQVPAIDLIEVSCRHAEKTEDEFCHTYSALVRLTVGLSPDQRNALQVDSVDDLVSTLKENVKYADDHQREPAAKILGEVCAICDSSVDVPQNLLDEVYTSSGWDREALLDAIGYLVTYRPRTIDDCDELFKNRIKTSTGPDRWYASRVVGEILAATASGYCNKSSVLIERVCETAGRERRLPARALGLSLVYTDGMAKIELTRIATRINNASGQTRRLAARALGEIIAAEPGWIPDIPEDLVNNVKDSTDWNHWMAAQVLGEVAAMGLCENDSNLKSLTTEVISSKDRNRRLAAQALGEAGLQDSKGHEEIPTELRDAVTTTTGPDRWLAARVCGEIIATRDNSEEHYLKSLRTEFQETTGRDKQLAAEALGLVIAFVSPPTIEAPSKLVEAVTQSTDRDRRLAAEALGRIVGANTEAETYTELARSVQDREGLNRWKAARLLGEVSAVLSPEDSVVPEAITRINKTSGDDRNWAARVVGEAIAVDRETSGELAAALKDRVLNNSGLDQRLASQTLGEVVSVQDPQLEAIPPGLSAEVQTQTGSDRWYAAWAVGLIVAHGSVQSAMTTIVSAMYDEPLEVDTLSPLLEVLSACGDLTIDQVMEAVADSQHQTTNGEFCLQSFFELGEKPGHDILTAIAATGTHSNSNDLLSQLRSEIHTLITDHKSIETESRLEAIDILVRVDT